MDMNTEIEQSDLDRQSPTMKAATKPKKPRKVAVKKAKAAKPKAKKVKAKKPAKKKLVKKAAKKSKPKAVKSAVFRSERLDMRLTKAEKIKVHAKAKKLRRTVTSIVIEAIEKIK